MTCLIGEVFSSILSFTDAKLVHPIMLTGRCKSNSFILISLSRYIAAKGTSV